MVKTKIQIRFNDVDLAGHVHNGIYLYYFEQGRMDYFNKYLGKDWDWTNYSLILAKNEVNYLQPIYLDDEIVVETSLEKIGNKSVVLLYKIYRGDVICTEGKSILVCYDYNKNESIIAPDIWRKTLK